MNTAPALNLTQWLTRWRRARRAFDARMLTERRLIVVAVACVTWYALDAVWVTPAYEAFHAAWSGQRQARAERAQLQAQWSQMEKALSAQQGDLQAEVAQLSQRLQAQDAELERARSQLVPARELRQVMEAMLARHGGLRLRSMKTLAPQEVRVAGVGSQALFRHGIDLTVEGGFHELLNWLQAVEALPRKLIWHSVKLGSDEQGGLWLSVQVQTLSPDRDVLEIAP